METADTILGVPIGSKQLHELVDEALSAIQQEGPRVVFACANPHSLVVAQSDEVFKKAICSANQIVADGAGITIISRIFGLQIGPRITGFDYFSSIMGQLEIRGKGRIYFFGSSQKVLDIISEKMRKHFPSLELCGVFSPPFRSWSPDENKKMIEAINAARPDVLWVGMTAPKQEKWVADNYLKLDVPVIGSIGAVFDFFAGTVPRAPAWMSKAGIEWLYRLIKEPRRMWKRNFVSTPKFVGMMLRKHFFHAGRN